MADFKTFLPVRKKPTHPAETFTGKLQTAMEYVEQPISTEGYATVLLRYTNGARRDDRLASERGPQASPVL